MARKILLSFLGTGNYKQCKYSSLEKGESKVVTYVQDAIIDLYCKDFRVNDKAYIFLTQAAEQTHWHHLEKILKSKINLEGRKNIPEGYSEAEIWSIFESVYDVLQKNDEIILDVTHGFRSLPMLQIVLLNYAKSLKNVKVKAILYGAFEALGPAFDIEKRIPDPSNRIAPLLDLTSFSAIQEWTFGAESFIKTGRSQTITELSMENIRPILIDSKGTDKTAADIRIIMNGLNQIENIISTNRGKLIEEGKNVKKVRDAVDRLSSHDDEVFSPIKPILGQIKDKLKDFGELEDWEAAVKWCIDNNLIQQGITQLQEGIISFLCDKFNLSKDKVVDRDLVAQSLNIYDQNKPEVEWREPAALHKEKVREILTSDFVKNHKDNFSRLSTIRNDINHGGYKQDSLQDPSQFKLKLQSIFKEFLTTKNK